MIIFVNLNITNMLSLILIRNKMKSMKSMKSMKYFILSHQSLDLYRQFLKSIQKIPDASTR